MNTVKKICVVCVVIIVNVIQAQQDPQYTQYMHNTATVNPAYLGSQENLSIVGLVRSQWIGLEGAPKTQTISFSSPIDYYKRLALGFSITNDAIGITSETYFNIDFSYNIPFGEYRTLSFGLKAVGHLLDVDFRKLSIFDVNESNFIGNINNRFSPNVGTGVYYNTDKFYVGASIPYLLDTRFYDKTISLDSDDLSTSTFLRKERLHFYLMGGYVFDLNDYIRFKPAFLTKVVTGAPLQADLSANFLINNKFTLGMAYRWSAAVSAMTAFRISDKFMIGFAYDRETTALGNTQFNDGSFEFLLKYHLPEGCCGRRRLIPRFF
jgi:type IX secretion system PorP/SprF family membrane protein